MAVLDEFPPPLRARGADTQRDGGGAPPSAAAAAAHDHQSTATAEGGGWRTGSGRGGRDPVPQPPPSPTRPTTVATITAAAAALGTGAAAVALMATSAWLIARAAEQPPVLHLLVAVTAVRFFGLSRGVLRYLDRLAAHRLGLRHQARARLDSYAALADQPMVGRRLGDLVARLVLDTEAAQDRVVRVRMPVLTAFGVGALAVTGFALLVPAAAVVLAGYLLLAGLVVPRLAGHVSARLDARIAPLGGELAEAVLRLHRHTVLLHLTGQEARGLEPARAAAARLREAEQRAATARGLGQLGAWLALAVTVVALLGVGGTAVAAGQLSGPALAVLALTPLALHELLLPLVDAEQARRRTAAALARLDGLQRPVPFPVRGDTASARQRDYLKPAGERAAVRTVRGDTGAPGVRDDLEPAEEWAGEPGVVLDGLVVGRTSDLTEPVSLRVRPGRRVVLVGPSGVGKSTLLATLLGQLAPRAGTVAVGGPVGCLTQDAHLFDTTVAENLRLGRPDATDAELLEALRRVRLDLPLERHVGEHGTRLSGGEARRVALARVLLAAPATVVLDEPTEHLDAETARALLRDVDTLFAGAPVLVVSHQPELLRQEWSDVEVVHLSARAGRAPSDPLPDPVRTP
ncbi:thiol reductant ABC exporter subunit CydC [Desertihabitans brevis]|uniref:thiol reductant ABC exporter subunit CydC n=1 Tax=Desertihabitans brevis TaxID=2268447 RepID=UPI002277D28C|nr:thiol reductant ABC exporter subunit CydC [Desertihabitans brevis]